MPVLALDNWTEAPGFTELFSQAFLGAQPPDDWGRDSFHLSDAAGCLRRAYYRMRLASDGEYRESLGFQEPPTAFSQEMTFLIGHAVHRAIQDYLVQAMGWCGAEDIEVPIRVPALRIKGSADAVVSIDGFRALAETLGLSERIPGGTHVVLDIKTKGDKTIKERPVPGKPPKDPTHTFPSDIVRYPEPKYFLQQQAYMGFLMEQYPERYPSIERAYLLYICKNDGRPFAIGIDYEPEALDVVRARASEVVSALDTREPPPPEYAQHERECRGQGNYSACPYYELCWSKALSRS